jgi:putative membrane protein insertion efficiency factor
MKQASRAIAVAPLLAYQRFVSPALGQRCRFEPSCSRYAVQAVREFGILRGLVLGGWRLLRCNPFGRGGFDPLSAQRLFCGHAHGAKQPRTEQ